MSSSSTSNPLPIYLNIYDITCFNKILRILGVGIYHTGIQIFDTEFAFYPSNHDRTGVIEESPFSNKKIHFWRQIKLGETVLPFREIEEIISDLKIEFIASTYDAFDKNCNHFSNEFSKKLLNTEIPSYLNRISCMTRTLKCFLSKNFVYGGAQPPKHRKTDSVNIAKNTKKGEKKKKRIEGGISISATGLAFQNVCSNANFPSSSDVQKQYSVVENMKILP